MKDENTILDLKTMRCEIEKYGEWKKSTCSSISRNKILHRSILQHTKNIQFHTSTLAEKIYFVLCGDVDRYCTECKELKMFSGFKIGYNKCLNRNCCKYERNTKKWTDNLKKSISLGRKNEKDIPNDIEILNYKDTQREILKLGEWTQGTNRQVYKNKQLYASILHHSKNKVFYGEKLSEKIYCILNDASCICPECNTTRKFISLNVGYSSCNNKMCSAFIRGIVSWRDKYSEKEYKEKIKQSYGKLGKLEWFKEKYPNDYEERYENYYLERHEIGIQNCKSNHRASKSANTFFAALLSAGYDGQCDINNKEAMFDVTDVKYIKNKNVIFVDFLYKNKIIEYDGQYWHNEASDNERDKYLTSIGYKVLRISDKDTKCKDGFNKSLQLAKDFLDEQ